MPPAAMETPAATPLAPDRLRTPCDAASLGFASTGELPPPELPFGQERAMEALRTGLATPGRGYNMFVMGRPGSGRHAAARHVVEAAARTRPAPGDCCYIYNFKDPQKPRVLTLPAGEGERLRAAMDRFVTELRSAVEAAFESEEYSSRLDAIQKEFKEREDAPLRALGEEALAQGILLVNTAGGFSFGAVRDGHTMSADEFAALPQEERERVQQAMAGLGERLAQLIQSFPRLRREMQVRIREFTRDTLALAAGQLIDEVKARFGAHEAVQSFLEEVRADIAEAGEQMREQPAEGESIAQLRGNLYLARYLVNVLVSHEPGEHAPVHACDNPTLAALVGRVDHVSHMGTLVTNFTMIRPGALHRANGGYLLVDALHVLMHAHAWEGLKRALRARVIRTESLPEVLGLSTTPMLEPEPVPLGLKVVMFGERRHYYVLQALDPEFDELFRIAADLEDDVPRNARTVADFARTIGGLARAQGLRPCDAQAVARLVEEASRIAGHANRLTTQTELLEELLHEASARAGDGGRACIARADVEHALRAREHRSDRLRDSLHEAVLEETLAIPTSGERAGQVNGLAVTELGDFRFGHPVRITATARLGDGHVVDIERESSLGRPLHSKGIMILGAFVGGRFARTSPLSFGASLVFEQSYGPVEGDSASLAELCALLSALSGVPLAQSLAVTGSVDQFGAVQAVGGINEKVEGFFHVCRARGLSGGQGVIIPATNVQHLMLGEEVVAAARAGRFHIHAVSDVDEALALLARMPAGTCDAAGRWPAGSFNQRVAARLEQLSAARHAFGMGLRPRPLPKPRRRAHTVPREEGTD